MDRDVIIYNLHQMIDYLQSVGNVSAENEYRELLGLVERGEEVPPALEAKLESVSVDPEVLANSISVSLFTVDDLINNATQLMEAYGDYQHSNRRTMEAVIKFLSSQRDKSIDQVMEEENIPSYVSENFDSLMKGPRGIAEEVDEIKETNMYMVLRVIYGDGGNIEEYQETNKLTSIDPIWDQLTRDQKLRYYYFDQINSAIDRKEIETVKSLLTEWFAERGIKTTVRANMTGVPFFIVDLPFGTDVEAIKKWIIDSGKLLVELPPSKDTESLWEGIISISPSLNSRIVRLSISRRS